MEVIQSINKWNILNKLKLIYHLRLQAFVVRAIRKNNNYLITINIKCINKDLNIFII